MTDGLSLFEKKLCNNLQIGLRICRRPYAETAGALGTEEEAVLEGIRDLVKRKIIRRIGVAVNWRAIGLAGALVTAHIEQSNLKDVVAAVNSLEGVSHNYLREHHYNLWFTLRADSEEEVKTILMDLSKRFGAAFHSLPAERIFKLDARFDAESEGRRLLISDKAVPESGPIALDETDREILSGLQKGLEVVAEPFEALCKGSLKIDEVLSRIEGLIDKGAISRLGAVVNHNKLGFTANAMFVCKAEKDKIEQLGQALARLGNVSHCYERKPFEGWPYNIFGMMHGRSLEEIRHSAEGFVREQGIKSFELLATAATLKK